MTKTYFCSFKIVNHNVMKKKFSFIILATCNKYSFYVNVNSFESQILFFKYLFLPTFPPHLRQPSPCVFPHRPKGHHMVLLPHLVSLFMNSGFRIHIPPLSLLHSVSLRHTLPQFPYRRTLFELLSRLNDLVVSTPSPNSPCLGQPCTPDWSFCLGLAMPYLWSSSGSHFLCLASEVLPGQSALSWQTHLSLLPSIYSHLSAGLT